MAQGDVSRTDDGWSSDWMGSLDWFGTFIVCYTWVYNGVYIYFITSSTAQGGGGSFKNRKPIGKVGCCESRMAERSH
jgi:hypothetical protein